MKKNIILSAIFISAILICSCKKSDNPPAYHISCYINDTLKIFNIGAIANIGSSNGIDIDAIGITGFSTTDQNVHSPSMDLMIENLYTKKIVAGTYTDTSATIQISSQYHAPAMDPSDYYCGNGVQTDARSINFKITNGLKIVFTNVSKTVMQGTFSGDYFYQGYHYGFDKPIHITNGSFYVNVQQ